MKVVVIGNVKIGSSLSSALVSEGHDVTIVDNNEAKLNRSKNTLDVMCIEGNGATSETQLEASVDKSQIVISVTPYDELNILSCLIAKRLGAEKTISRVRMPEYFKQMHLIIRNNDRLSIAATHKSIEKFFRSSGLMKDKVKSVMIAGGGMIGYYLASQLLAVGMRVKIIEKDEDRSLEIARLLPQAIVIHGDGTDQALLMEEGIMSADAFVALTGIDEENIILSLFAKENTNAKVVTKINRDNYINIASQIGIDCIVSPKSLVVSNVISYVRSLDNAADSEIESLYHLVGGEVEAIEFKVKENVENVVGIPLKDMKLKGNILISAIIRKREIIIPDGNTEIELGDSVVIVAKEHRFSKLKDILA